ncbi:hypothetical protein QVD17_42277 [Tagetes erecta]|uniref:Uncharacterized protein n=1 Tax=Tagetes erecta TaxID=13708 RepID=A0AAD8N8Q6_TARER|nr:hypothetical protein QVD17_42277 [Tagetes erecta]
MEEFWLDRSVLRNGLNRLKVQYGLNDTVWRTFSLKLTLSSQRFGNLDNMLDYVTRRIVGLESVNENILGSVSENYWAKSGIGLVLVMVVGLIFFFYCKRVVLEDVWAMQGLYSDGWVNIGNGMDFEDDMDLFCGLDKENVVRGYWIWTELGWYILCGLRTVTTTIEKWAAHALEGWYWFGLLFFAFLMVWIVIGFVKWAIRIALFRRFKLIVILFWVLVLGCCIQVLRRL